MTSWTSLADRIFKREERCEKLIKYQDRSFEFKGVGAEIPGFKFSFEGFNTEPKVLQEATEAAKALDDFQYLICQDLSKKSATELLDRDLLIRYAKARMSSQALFLNFRATLVAFGEDPERQRINLEKSIEDIQKFTASLTMEDLDAPKGLSLASCDVISSALKAAEVDEQELDRVLLDRFAEFEKRQREILERIKQVRESFERQITELRLSGTGVRLITASKQYNKGDPNCWKDAYFEDADIRNGYDARRSITDDIIKSIEAHEGTFVYGDPYVGKSILVKRVMFELADKGYAVIYSSGGTVESNAYQINDLLSSLSKTYAKIVFVVDDAHKVARELYFEIFNELYDTTDAKNIHFLFAAREKQLNKEKHIIERALRKVPKEAQFRIGFSLEDAVLFLQQAMKVTGKKAASTFVIDYANLLYAIYRGDPFMISLIMKYFLDDKGQELEDIISKEMRALITKIEEIEEKERIQNNELWQASIMSAIMGIANIMLERKSHTNLFTCSKIPPRRFGTLLENDILLKESDEGELGIRNEIFAYEFLSALYENNFNNNAKLFNAHYGYIVKCIWDSIGVNEIIDLLNSCSNLYDNERYRPISELVTSAYLVPFDEFSPPSGIDDSDKAKIFCYGLGNFYLSRKEYEKALVCYDKALNIKPDFADAWNNRGNALDNLGKYKDALASYDKAIELKPNFTYGWNGKGNALYGLHRYGKALECYDRAIKIDAKNVFGWNGKGNALVNLSEYEEAIVCYDKAIELKPDYAYPWNGKGNALYGLHRYGKALECYDRAIKIDAKNVFGWNGKGNALVNLSEYEEAIVCYDKAIELKPDHADAWYGKGNTLSKLERYEEAIDCYDKAIELNPDYADAWYGKGVSLSNLCKHEEAIDCYDKAIELKPDHADAWYGKGNTLSKLERYEEAIVCYDKALEIDANITYAWNNKGLALSNLCKHEEAINCYDKALEIDPNNADAWFSKGLVLSYLDRHEEAIVCYDKDLEIEPNDVNALNDKGAALNNLGKYEEAIVCYDKAINLSPNYADAWFNKGLALNNFSKYEEAITCYDKAIELNPNNVDAWYDKGYLLDSLGKYEEAITCYDKAIELNPNNVDAWFNKGAALDNLGKYEEAIVCYDKDLEIEPNDVNALNDKGAALNNLGKHEEAIKCYDKAIELNPNYADVWYNRACSQVQQNNIEGGLADLKKAIDIDKEYIDSAKEDKDFDSIRNDERFKALVG